MFLLDLNCPLRTTVEIYVVFHYLKPPDFNDLSGEFALESGWKVFFDACVGQCFQDRHWSLWKVSEIQTVHLESRVKFPPPHIYRGRGLPLTVSRAVVRTPSAEKAMVPVSSRVRLDSVRLWTSPLVLTLHWLFALTLTPSFCQVPSTSV